MKKLDVNKKLILDRVSLIKLSLSKLEDLKPLSPGRFMLGENFAVAEHYLRYALEATFDICAHILSKIPGVMASEYKEMAIKMGQQEIIPMNFAQEKLHEMAGYRNRLTHFYFEVKPKEMYKIIQDDLKDFEIFMKHIKKLLK